MINQDYNKRCAEFLSIENPYHKGHYICPNGIATKPEDMKFDSDWNWIMEVVEAIKEKTSFKTVDECTEEEWYVTTGVTKLTLTTPKQIVVQAIDKYLIWYAAQKDKEK